MALKLISITNNPEIANIAELSGVDWIMVDLELIGKMERQGHLDTLISRHNIEDVSEIRRQLKISKLLVRVNPMHSESKKEIEKVIESGADIIMLPYFKTEVEVANFINIVDHRAKVCLLLETPEAVLNIDAILALQDIDYIHIGLNDLHLGYGKKFMFELLSDNTVESISRKILSKNIEFGFGGIARLGEGRLPAENIIPEHYRLDSKIVILSRSFYAKITDMNLTEFKNEFTKSVKEIRNYEKIIEHKSKEFFYQNKQSVDQIVEKIVTEMAKRQI